MRVKKFPKFTKLLIVWNDITSDASWHNINKLDKVKTVGVKTLGFFLENKKRELKIAHSITEDGDGDYTVIPWGCVKSIEVF